MVNMFSEGLSLPLQDGHCGTPKQAQGYLLSKWATQRWLSSALFDFFFPSYTMCQSFAHRIELWLFQWPNCVSLEGGSRLLMADIQAEDIIRLNSDLQHSLQSKTL